MVENITMLGVKIIGLYRTNYLNRFHVREMAKLLKKSHAGLLPHLKKFEKNKILKNHYSGKNKNYTLNLNNRRGIEYLSMAEKIIGLRLIEREFFIKKIYDEAINLNFGGCLIIFGSYASGNQTKDSDLDVFYLGDINERQKKKMKGLWELYKKDVHFLCMNAEEFRNALLKDVSVVNEIIKNHVIVYNHNVFINELWRYYYERRER